MKFFFPKPLRHVDTRQYSSDWPLPTIGGDSSRVVVRERQDAVLIGIWEKKRKVSKEEECQSLLRCGGDVFDEKYLQHCGARFSEFQ